MEFYIGETSFEATFKNYKLPSTSLYNQLKDKNLIPGILFQKLVLYYFVFRFLIEFIRGTEKNILFLSIYQVICLIGIIFIIRKIKKERELWKIKQMEKLLNKLFVLLVY